MQISAIGCNLRNNLLTVSRSLMCSNRFAGLKLALFQGIFQQLVDFIDATNILVVH